MPVLIVIAFVVCLLIKASEALDQLDLGVKFAAALSPITNNIYLIFAGLCLGSAAYVYFLFKPHKAAKYFESYKNGLITRKQAIEKISGTLYTTATGLPPAWKSKITTFRLKELRKRVQEETGFIDDVAEYMKKKVMRDTEHGR